MKELLTQIKNECPSCRTHIGEHLIPWAKTDLESIRGYKLNQPLRTKIQGAEKERSLVQLQMYWVLCEQVAQQISDHEKQYTKNDVDFHVKVKVAKDHPSMIKRYKSIDGVVFMELISIAFRNMKHLTACKYFDLAFPIMARMVGCTVEELLAKS